MVTHRLNSHRVNHIDYIMFDLCGADLPVAHGSISA